MNKLTILDGGMGRELQRIGAPFSQPLWSAQALIESPEHVRQAHQNFIDAGAEMIITNAYACVPFHLGEQRYQEQGFALAEQAAIIAKQVAQANEQVQVAGSLPPPMGSYRPDLFDAEQGFAITDTLYRAQAEHVDLWLAETISSVDEALMIAKVLAKTNKPCYYAFTLNDEVAAEAILRSGETVTAALEALAAHNVAGILFNCCIPEVIEQALRDVNAFAERHGKQWVIGAYPNCFTPIRRGLQANDTLQEKRAMTPEEFVEFAQTWQQLGATLIGGCCGIEPMHIAALSQWRDGQ